MLADDKYVQRSQELISTSFKNIFAKSINTIHSVKPNPNRRCSYNPLINSELCNSCKKRQHKSNKATVIIISYPKLL